tara:strand:+ start:883 stop:1221 length:339 start_codon:yes stop_codon:yes gene_type:complete
MTWEEVLKSKLRIYDAKPVLETVLRDWSETAQKDREYTMLEIRKETYDDFLNTLVELYPEKRKHSIIMNIRDFNVAPTWKWDNTISAILEKQLSWVKKIGRNRKLKTLRRVA